MQRITYILILIFSSTLLMAQTFSVNAPSAVEVGQQVQITYTLNASGKNIQAPDFGDFDFLGGPSVSNQSSTQIVNGKRQSSRSQSYSYYVRANKPGKYKIGPAQIQANGKTIKSKSISIKVVGGGATQQQAQTKNTGATTKADVFIRTFISKSEVYQGEAITCTVKFFTKNEYRLTGYKEPQFTGFWKETIEDIDQNPKNEAYNDKVYATVVIAKYVLYPNQSGEIEIPAAEVDAIVRTYKTRKARNQTERMFYGNTIKQPIDKEIKLKSPARKLKVKSLPASGKPAGFNGLVGNFKLKSTISFTEVNVDDAINLSYTIEGKGNIDLLELPQPIFPPDFDMFDPEISQNSNTNEKGVSGKKSFKYILIPRSEGTFKIPALEFSFFDTQSGKYKNVKSESYTVKVGDGISKNSGDNTGSYSDNKKVHYVDQDIRFVHQNIDMPGLADEHLMKKWITPLYFSLTPILMLVFIFWRRKQNTNRQDVQLMRYKKATKLAKQHLRNAMSMLKAGNASDFYIEISKVLWGYLSDKFSIPRSDLSIAEIVDQLSSLEIDPESIKEIKEILEQCEFARFAPAEENKSNMQHIYDESLLVISKIEKGIK